MRIQQFTYEADISPAVLWQYSNTQNLLTLITNKQDWLTVNQTEFWENWYNTVFNLSTTTPTLFGVSVWAIILNIPLFVPLNPESPSKPNFGFNAYDPTFPTLENSYLNFGVTITANPGSGNFSTRHSFYELTVQEQQFLLRVRYFQLCNLGDINDINRFFNHLCMNNTIAYTGTIYVLDNLDMTISYVFTTDDFPPDLFSVLTDLDIFPRPAGTLIVPS